MLNPVQFTDEPELFEALTVALDESDEFDDVDARNEEDGYGHSGYIMVRIGGKVFSLSAYEVV
jgi:hypothetical protein